MWLCIVVTCLAFLSLYRAAVGPTAADRTIALNAIGTKVVLIVAMLSIIDGTPQLLDVAMAYALMNFLGTCGVARYLEMERQRSGSGGDL